MSTRSPRKDLISVLLSTIGMLWTGLILSFLLVHDMFRDEQNAWLIAKSKISILDWFELIRYEGRPPLYFILLRGLSLITGSPNAPKALMILIAAAVCILILSERRLNPFLKVLMLTTLPFFGIYFVYVRDYALIVLLLAAVFRFDVIAQPGRKWNVIVVLLLAFTNLFGWMFALAITASLVGSTPRIESEPRWQNWKTGAVLVSGLVGAAALMIRPTDSISPLKPNIEENLVTGIKIFIYKFNETLFPIGVNTRFGGVFPILSVPIVTVFAFGLLVLVAVALWLRSIGRAYVVTFAVFSLLFFGNLAIGYSWYWWHFGMFHGGVITLIFSGLKNREKGGPGFRYEFLYGLAIATLVVASIAGNIFGPGSTIFTTQTFSNASLVAESIEIECSTSCLVTTADMNGSVSVAGYLNRSVYSVTRDEFQTHFAWNESEFSSWSWEEVLLVGESYRDLFFVSEVPLEFPSSFYLFGEFSGAIWENFWIYKRI
jgi:hypothetical protein